jgi:hypothetical protein
MTEISFPFLRLPAKLRNKVYEFAVADTKDDDTCLFYKKDPQYGREEYIREQYGGERYGKGPDICSSSYLGLIEVCRKIRTEFRPLLYSAWNPVIGFHSIPEFLATFTPEASSPTFAKITVQIDEHDTAGHETQLLWLLRSCARATTWTFQQFQRTQTDRDMSSSMSTSTSSTSSVPSSLPTFNTLSSTYNITSDSQALMLLNIIFQAAMAIHCVFLKGLTRLEHYGYLHSLPLDHFHSLQLCGNGVFNPEWLLHYGNEANKPTAEMNSRVLECCKALGALFPRRVEFVGGHHVEVHVGTVQVRLEDSAGYILADYLWDFTRDAVTKVFV